MGLFAILSILIFVTALCSLVNYHILRMPMTIGVMISALVASFGVLLLGELGAPGLKHVAARLLHSIDFNQALLHGMLALLLFAGALHVDLSALRSEKTTIALLATVGVLASTLMVGTLVYLLLIVAGLKIAFIYCLLFGALISPTDPIAVLGIMKNAGAPPDLETQVAGESLFNDGIGVVLFMVLLAVATGGEHAGPGSAVLLMITEALGGALFGLTAGLVTYYLLKGVNNYQVEVLLTLALSMGGYALAERLHVSAPIAIVVAGLLIGNHGRQFAMSATTREHLDSFWELIDEILNAVLFVLIGLEVLVIPLFKHHFISLAVIPVVLFARWASVSGMVYLLRNRQRFNRGAVPILTWGGLRGGISVALALSLPVSETRNVILTITYAVVLFSIIVQGLTIGRVIRRYRDEPVDALAEPITSSPAEPEEKLF